MAGKTTKTKKTSPLKGRNKKTTKKTSDKLPEPKTVLKLPEGKFFPVIDTTSITNANEDAKELGREPPYPEGKIGDVKHLDKVYISFELEDEEYEGPNAYMAQCIYANAKTGTYVMQYYQCKDRLESDPTHQIFSAEDTDKIFFIEREEETKKSKKKNRDEILQNLQERIEQQTEAIKDMSGHITQQTERMCDSIRGQQQEVQQLTTAITEMQPNKVKEMHQHMQDIRKMIAELPKKLEEGLPPTRNARINPLQQSYQRMDNWMQPPTIPQMQNTYPVQTVDMSVIIKNIPYRNDEKKTLNLERILKKIISVKNLGHPIIGMINPYAINDHDYTIRRAMMNEQEIDDTKPPPIVIITFKSKINKTNFLAAKGNLTLTNICDFMTLTEEEKKQTIYINENLTEKQRYLYYLARQKKKELGYRFCWTRHGSVFMRKDEHGKVTKIEKESDLKDLQA
jgi:uncharacterized protein YoxC